MGFLKLLVDVNAIVICQMYMLGLKLMSLKKGGQKADQIQTSVAVTPVK